MDIDSFVADGTFIDQDGKEYPACVDGYCLIEVDGKSWGVLPRNTDPLDRIVLEKSVLPEDFSQEPDQCLTAGQVAKGMIVSALRVTGWERPDLPQGHKDQRPLWERKRVPIAEIRAVTVGWQPVKKAIRITQHRGDNSQIVECPIKIPVVNIRINYSTTLSGLDIRSLLNCEFNPPSRDAYKRKARFVPFSEPKDEKKAVFQAKK